MSTRLLFAARVGARSLVLAATFVTLPALAQAPQGGVAVSFNSKDQTGAVVPLKGVLFVPSGESKGAVVLMHGSSGWSDYREGHYARAFSAAGYTVLAVDSFGSRGIGSTTEDQLKLSLPNNIRDAFAGKAFLRAQGVPGQRIAVMGFSRGGIVAMRAADKTFLPEEQERFAAAIAFYPGCNARPRQPKPSSVVFMGLGEKDDYTGVKSCQHLAADYSAAGGKITVKVFPDSSHAFDGNPANTRMVRLPTVENYMDCAVVIEPDGQQAYGGQLFAAEDFGIYDELRKSCVKKGASFWSNPAQKEIATKDAIAFLDASLH